MGVREGGEAVREETVREGGRGHECYHNASPLAAVKVA